ncbi:MAG TPA: fructose-bisphosphate aldolase [Candidatus Nanoarchaeia archaeon]|nr:fructose-bisphosphate aldolase [Candidatus Nanoarchaeia archaeon]
MAKELVLSRLLTTGKCLFLAYDQGLEHGPTDFNDENINPLYIIALAKKGKFNAFICQKGIAEKYKKEIKASKIPLIFKLNGKTNLSHGEPLSTQLCTVTEAVKLGAIAVGYTIYIGSEHEAVMLKEFEEIEREAHAKGMPVIAWIYPRGKSVAGKPEKELLAYSARVGLEIGADIVKLHWNGNKSDLEWAVKAAGKCKLVVAGGLKTDERTLLKQARDAMQSGASGLAIGRNIWQAKNPLELTKKIKKIIWNE